MSGASSDFAYVSYIAAAPERLWAALTDGKLSREYWGGRAVESDLKTGSPMRWRKADGQHDVVRATVLDARPPWYLALNWTYELEPEAALPPASRVTYTIEKAGPDSVKLTVVHRSSSQEARSTTARGSRGRRSCPA